MQLKNVDNGRLSNLIFQAFPIPVMLDPVPSANWVEEERMYRNQEEQAGA